MDPLEVEAAGYGLNGVGDVDTGNPRGLVVAVMALEARMQGIEPWGRTLWFYTGGGCKETNHPPRSLCLP